MTSLLKAMGVLVWSLAAVGLLFIGGAVGFRALRGFPSARPSTEPPAAVTLPDGATFAIPDDPASTNSNGSPVAPGAQRHDLAGSVASRARLREAAARHDTPLIIRYGKELSEAGLAGPEDIADVAVAYYLIGDCSEALRWTAKTQAARAGSPPVPALNRLKSRCGTDVPVTGPTTIAAGHPSGEHDVHLGELFYGFNDYSRAVDFLRKGLQAGGLKHPDEAYVYLGRAYLALGDDADACQAFDDLTRVEGVSPRVYRLWTLYADMHCMTTNPR